MPRGGKRSGKPGGLYPNRSDLRGPGTPDIPKQEFQGQPYGAATQQAQAQQVAPVAAPPMPAPGSLGAFNRPTERPDEPITAGLPSGPGPGPEVLGALGEEPDQGELRDMAVYLPMLEMLASLPDSTMATRNFVRRLRGAVPPQNQG